MLLSLTRLSSSRLRLVLEQRLRKHIHRIGYERGFWRSLWHSRLAQPLALRTSLLSPESCEDAPVNASAPLDSCVVDPAAASRVLQASPQARRARPQAPQAPQATQATQARRPQARLLARPLPCLFILWRTVSRRRTTGRRRRRGPVLAAALLATLCAVRCTRCAPSRMPCNIPLYSMSGRMNRPAA